MFGIVPNFGRVNRGGRDVSVDMFGLAPFFQMGPGLMNDFAAAGTDILSTDIRVNVEDCDDKYIVDAMVPGAAREDVDVSFDDGILSIEIAREESEEETKRNIVYREVSTMKCVRKMRFLDVDGSGIEATLSDGVLKVTLPKSTPEDTKVHVEVN